MLTSMNKSRMILSQRTYINFRNAAATGKRKTKQRAGNDHIYSRFMSCLERVFRRTRIYYYIYRTYLYIYTPKNIIILHTNVNIWEEKHVGYVKRSLTSRPHHRVGRSVSGHTRGHRRRRVVIFNPKGHRK